MGPYLHESATNFLAEDRLEWNRRMPDDVDGGQLAARHRSHDLHADEGGADDDKALALLTCYRWPFRYASATPECEKHTSINLLRIPDIAHCIYVV